MKHIDWDDLELMGQKFTEGEYEYWVRPAQNSLPKDAFLVVLRRKIGKVSWQYCKEKDSKRMIALCTFGEAP